ncbi:MAG: hypothetical protein KKE57_04065 [Proteobacteria bacterium]|nr:hypothetical protein [Pseudomonadota bacterium]
MDKVIEVVCKGYNVERKDLAGPSRIRSLSEARGVVGFLCRQTGAASLTPFRSLHSGHEGSPGGEQIFSIVGSGDEGKVPPLIPFLRRKSRRFPPRVTRESSRKEVIFYRDRFKTEGFLTD